MSFTPLHRYLGEPAGPLTEQMIDEAIARGLLEADDLDWKAKLPTARDLARSDLSKDIAAMANSGGGMLVFGVIEEDAAASGRVDAGEIDENYLRTLRRVAYTGISPAVTGIDVFTLGDEGARAVAVVIPDSVDAPHLVYKDQYFGAPVRNNSDTEWMKERQIELAYRARFRENADTAARMRELYVECRQAYSTSRAAQIIAVAQPRHPFRQRTQRVLGDTISDAWHLSNAWTGGETFHVLNMVEGYRPQVGFRRLMAVSAEGDPTSRAHVAVHDDGAITMAWTAGAESSGASTRNGSNEVRSADIEVFVSDFLALVRKLAESTPGGEMVVNLGIEWEGVGAIACFDTDHRGRQTSRSETFAGTYSHVSAMFAGNDAEVDYYSDVRAFAADCLTQFGIRGLSVLHEVPRPLRR